jgi:propanol-preferring alcohol dehydrogenase
MPEPLGDQILVRVKACGVCRTDLHVVEGELKPRKSPLIPGHQVVGVIEKVGPEARRFPVGARVGIAWLHQTDGVCEYCRAGRENLCEQATFTGYTVDGGYAEYAVAPEAFVYPIPESFSDLDAAPLLCAGIIGFRALLRAALPPGGRLGLYGFGGSAHLCAQLALAQGATVHVLTRDPAARRLALELGAASARGAYDEPPEPLDSAILFAPVGDLVPVALRALDRGGILSVAGIHLSDTPPLHYESDLFYEKELRSVTSNTRRDGRDFLALAARHGVRATTHAYPLSEAQRALRDLKAGRFDGAAVLVNDFPART